MNSLTTTQHPKPTKVRGAYLYTRDINDLYGSTYEDYQVCLTSTDATFRASIWDNPNFKPLAEDYRKGLLDNSPEIRFRVWQRTNFCPTIVDIELGLRDKDEEVRHAALRRSKGNLTDQQIKRALKDPNSYIRSLIWDYQTWTPTAAQIKKALRDEDHLIRRKAIRREDVELNPQREAFALDLSNIDGDEERLSYIEIAIKNEIEEKRQRDKINKQSANN